MNQEFDPSFEADPNKKGYRRALNDINLVFDLLGIEAAPPNVSFLHYYFGAEKVAKAIVGISKRYPSKRPISKKEFCVEEICRAIDDIDLTFDKLAIEDIFGNSPLSARKIRNRFVHQIGPSHAMQIRDNAVRLVPMMKDFVERRTEVFVYLERLKTR